MARGTLRIYLGASPGVGKTFAMLNEGQRRRERGADVVIGVVETHGRARTAEQLGDLEVVDRRVHEYRGSKLAEMDVDAILQRRPEVVLVDEFAHTNAPGSRNEKRWQDVEQLLDAGIDVISTVNIQHLESLNDVVEKITGVAQRETVPDTIVRRADQIELVDMSPEALRRRMAHGNIYPAERIDAAMTNFFRPGNLSALRELALLWLADRVEESLTQYLRHHDIDTTWETRERVVVGISGAQGGDALIRRAARLAGRHGGELIGVHVVRVDGLAGGDDAAVAAQRRLVEELGGRTNEVIGSDPAAAIVEFARGQRATQVVIGATRRSRSYELLHGSLVTSLTRLAPDLDIHVMAGSVDETPARRTERPSTLRRRRTAAAWIATALGLPLLTLATSLVDERVALSTILLAYLTAVLGIAALGGRLIGVVASIAASLLVNWFFVEPRYTLTIGSGENAVALAVFLITAFTVGLLVDRSARRAAEANLARAEAAVLARSAASLATDPEPVAALLEQLRTTFGLDSATLHIDGEDTDERPSAAASTAARTEVLLAGRADGASRRLVLVGRSLSADDRRVIGLLGDQLVVADDTETLTAEAAAAAALAEVDVVRTALLRAVSHDLRTPLAAIKALVTGLLQPDVSWSAAQVHDTLEAVDEQTDRMNDLVANLLNAGRLQAGAVAVTATAVDIDELIGELIEGLVDTTVSDPLLVDTHVPAGTVAWADRSLLHSAVVNVVRNALEHGHSAEPVVISAEQAGDGVQIRVVDRGKGIEPDDRARVLAPFQRLGDQHQGRGVGLGLAIAHGFIRSMGGDLELDDTPGGGLSVTITLPAAPPMAAPR